MIAESVKSLLIVLTIYIAPIVLFTAVTSSPLLF
jgi:hypothetical protein